MIFVVDAWIRVWHQTTSTNQHHWALWALKATCRWPRRWFSKARRLHSFVSKTMRHQNMQWSNLLIIHMFSHKFVLRIDWDEVKPFSESECNRIIGIIKIWVNRTLIGWKSSCWTRHVIQGLSSWEKVLDLLCEPHLIALEKISRDKILEHIQLALFLLHCFYAACPESLFLIREHETWLPGAKVKVSPPLKVVPAI